MPDREQAACIANVWDNVQIVARAGSGKTSTIINKTIFLINHCKIHPSEILILAFNKDAAEEVNKRLEKVLKQESPQAMTFHALAYGIVHPKENLIYDQLENLGKSKSVQNVIDSYIHNPKYADEFRTFMLKYFKKDWNRIILKGHNLSKKEMIEYRRSLPNIGLDGRYYKSMGEKRIADYLFEFDIPYYYEYNFSWNGINYRPNFTIKLNKNTIKRIVIEYFGLVGDLDYDKDINDKINYWKSRKEYLFLDMYPKDAKNMDSIEDFLDEKLKAFFPNMEKLPENEIWNRIKKRAVDEFSKVSSSFISRCRKLMLTIDSIADLVIDKTKQNELSDLELDFLRIIWKIYRDYLESLKQNGEQDFDGLMEQAIEVVNQGKLEWNRRKGADNLGSIKYLFIDEFQDFPLLFFELISAIRKHNDYVKLFCVGDDWQAINNFAGSDLKYFNEFEEIINNSKKLYITTNYRSYQNIVQVGNQVMKEKGEPSVPDSTLEGNVLVTYLDRFKQSDMKNLFIRGI
nr:UvrD-helicase domain-containing protein [Lysinibacillus fusiformis]